MGISLCPPPLHLCAVSGKHSQGWICSHFKRAGFFFFLDIFGDTFKNYLRLLLLTSHLFGTLGTQIADLILYPWLTFYCLEEPDKQVVGHTNLVPKGATSFLHTFQKLIRGGKRGDFD